MTIEDWKTCQICNKMFYASVKYQTICQNCIDETMATDCAYEYTDDEAQAAAEIRANCQ